MARSKLGRVARPSKPDPSRRREGPALLIATRKGLFVLRAGPGRRSWRLSGPHFLGNIVHHAVLDPRDRRTLLIAARTGHLGPTVFRSLDFGKTWLEAKQPPAFPKAQTAEDKREVDHVFWLTPGHASEPGVWYAGTSPQGLFRSRDGGVTWDSVAGFNENPMRAKWTGGPGDGTPDGPKMHSILIDPRDARHSWPPTVSTSRTTAGSTAWSARKVAGCA